MTSRHLTWLAVAAAVAIAAAIWAARERAPDTGGSSGQPLVPGLEAAVNDVDRIDIGTGGDPQVTLERDEDGWTVAQKSSYAADIGKLREMLLALADATVLERKTSDPEHYGQLGVGDQLDEDASGAWLEIAGLGEPVRLVIGDNARGGSSTYARRGGEESALLVSGNLDIEKQPIEWLRRDILDVAADSVQAVTITHRDGRALEVSKERRGLPDFSITGIPAGQQVKSAADVNSVASALTGLRLEDVRPAEEMPADDTVRAVFSLFDGTVLTVQAFERDEQKLVHVDVEFDEALAEAMAQAAAAAAATPDAAAAAIEPAAPGEGDSDAIAQAARADAETAAESQRAEREAARAKAAALQARLDPWLFEVSDYKYEQLTRDAADLFESTVPDAAADGD
ncbi:MAG TPA: DUF4340 domain-containing protein [Gammaproteobacteria bacterium]|nr:DUF4340 domain-containing protein [Gammaproteobacteria bacterium]